MEGGSRRVGGGVCHRATVASQWLFTTREAVRRLPQPFLVDIVAGGNEEFGPKALANGRRRGPAPTMSSAEKLRSGSRVRWLEAHSAASLAGAPTTCPRVEQIWATMQLRRRAGRRRGRTKFVYPVARCKPARSDQPHPVRTRGHVDRNIHLPRPRQTDLRLGRPLTPVECLAPARAP